ncbi:MAG: PASTA domain-containing protein [bacterium]
MEKEKVNLIFKLSVIGFIFMLITAATIMKIIFVLSVISVPDFTGMKTEKAQKKASRMHIDLKIADEIYSPLYETGCIVSQDIAAQTKIKKGRTVYLVVSKGSKIVSIPDITMQQKSAALVTLRNNALLDGNDTLVASTSYRENTVMAQSPCAGQETTAGIKVNMLRSSGQRKKDFLMPDLTGINAFAAFSSLRKNKFLIEKLSVEPNEELASGTILSQDPPAGYIVNEKKPISLKASIKQSDTTLKKRIIKIIYANPDTLPQLVSIKVLSLNGSETLYNEVAQPNEPININATILGDALVQIWNGTEIAKEMEFKN